MSVINYDTNKFDFRSKIKQYLDFEELNKIHETYKFEDILKKGTDQNQVLHRKFYDGMDEDSGFSKMYLSFIEEVIAPRYDGQILFQKFPTFRVHQPSNIGTFGWHKDSDYNHNENEVNYYMPMTKAYDTNTVWRESSPGKEDYSPSTLNYGELLEWDGANCVHGTKINETEDTRMSFDFRILTLENYKKSDPKTSISKGKKFEIGHYFDLL